LSRAIDTLNYYFGVAANYLVLFAALLSAANAFFRYGINALISLSRDFHFRFTFSPAFRFSSTGTATTPTRSWKRSGTCSPPWCCSVPPGR
jgi:hypothetical protein